MVSTEERSCDLHSFFSESMFPTPNYNEVEGPFVSESRLEVFSSILPLPKLLLHQRSSWWIRSNHATGGRFASFLKSGDVHSLEVLDKVHKVIYQCFEEFFTTFLRSLSGIGHKPQLRNLL